MSPRFVEVLLFVVTTILVGLFFWIYARDRQHKSWLWLLGWLAIFLHFAVPVLDDWLLWLVPAGVWINVATLIVAGTFFLLSVSDVYARSRRRAAFIVLITGAGLIYLTALTLHAPVRWFYVLLLAGSTSVVLLNSARHYGWKHWFVVGTSVVFIPYVGWAMLQALSGKPIHGLRLYLCAFFTTTGVLYLRHFRRLTPGVILTSISFLVWGVIFPAAPWLIAHNLGPRPDAAFWDIPKFFVAFGMILTLLENQTEAAHIGVRRYRELFEANLAAVYLSTFEGKLLDCNSAFLQMYGFSSKEEALATPAPLIYTDAIERDRFLSVLESRGQVVNYECRQRRRDGSEFWILERAIVVREPDGRRAIEGTAIDITERKYAELALRESEERFATIFRQSLVGCVIVSLEGVILNANDQMLRLIGRSAKEVIGKTAVELELWRNQLERDEFFNKLRTEGRIQDLEVKFKDSSGKKHEGLYFATLLRIGEEERIFGMLLDQTEKRELEARFLQAQKMESLGRLAGGVAHDFNNLLGIMGGYAELLDARLGQQEQYRRYCSKIVETTQRASRLTQQLLTFSRKEITRPTPLRPDQVLGELCGILPGLIGEQIELSVDLRSTGTVVMDKTHFEQIVFNLVVNARDAMPDGGQLLIETEDVALPSPNASDSRWYSALRVRDNGAGMDEATIAHAFEPFFTTKDMGRGSGLGLATVYGIVQQCQGEISINSKPGRGTEINILLPVVSDLELPAPETSPPELVKGRGSILLVEDEVDLRETNAEFLASIGYSVLCAGSGPEALTIAQEAGPIDLVISDVVMPRMRGREFISRLLELRPDAKLLFVSGYADDVVLQNGISRNGTPFLQKPYSLHELGRKVQELLRQRKSSAA